MIALIAPRIFVRVPFAGLNGDLNERQRPVSAEISDFVIRHGIPPCGNVDAPIDLEVTDGLWRPAELSKAIRGRSVIGMWRSHRQDLGIVRRVFIFSPKPKPVMAALVAAIHFPEAVGLR
jgi:hypothetical protein